MPSIPRPTLPRPSFDPPSLELGSFELPSLEVPASAKSLAYTAVGLNVLAFDQLRARLAERGIDLGREIAVARDRAEDSRQKWQQQLDLAGEQLQRRVAAVSARVPRPGRPLTAPQADAAAEPAAASTRSGVRKASARKPSSRATAKARAASAPADPSA